MYDLKAAQLCPNFFDPLDYTVHGILQATILECAVIPFSRGSSQPRDGTQVSHIAGGFFTSWATGKLMQFISYEYLLSLCCLEEIKSIRYNFSLELEISRIPI